MAGPTPLVSVVVPVFNAGDLLARSLASLADQAYTPLEVVVVDDGSTDASLAIARECADTLPVTIHVIASAHAGRAVARQTGVEHCSGEFIGFVDSDDLAHPELYARLVAAILAEKDADVAVCRYQNIALDGAPGHVYEEGTPALFGTTLAENPAILLSVEASLCNKLFRASLFDGVAFPAGHDFEDLATTYRLMGSARRIVKVDSQPLYFYRQGGPVSVMGARDERYADIAVAIRTNCDFFRGRGEFEALEPHLLRMALRHLVFSRFGAFFDHVAPAVAWPYIDRVYATLDEEFPGWRRSTVLAEMCGSRYSLALVRSATLMKGFSAVRSLGRRG